MKKKDIEARNKKSREHGSILLATIFILALLVVFPLPYVLKISSQYRTSEKSLRSLAALNLAEAGVERAIWELNYGDISSWSGDSSMRTMAIPSFQASDGNVIGDIEIKVINPDGNNPVVEAMGKVLHIGAQMISKSTRVVLERSGSQSIFDFGIFGDEGVTLNSNVNTDSYDSRDGLYGGSNIGAEGNVGTNSTQTGGIYLNSNANIYGNAVSGPESNPEQVIVIRSNAHIYGETQALSELKDLYSVPPPEGLPFRGSFTLASNGQATISESGEYTSFLLSSNSKVTITADVTLYITGNFSMRSNTQFEIANGASATIYLGGTFAQRSNSQINNLSQDPTKLLFLGTDSFNGEMEWNSNTQFWGVVYVPEAEVDFNSNSNFYGSLMARYIDLASNAIIHYDEALGDLNFNQEEGSSIYTVKSWQETSSFQPEN